MKALLLSILIANGKKRKKSQRGTGGSDTGASFSHAPREAQLGTYQQNRCPIGEIREEWPPWLALGSSLLLPNTGKNMNDGPEQDCDNDDDHGQGHAGAGLHLPHQFDLGALPT